MVATNSSSILVCQVQSSLTFSRVTRLSRSARPSFKPSRKQTRCCLRAKNLPEMWECLASSKDQNILAFVRSLVSTKFGSCGRECLRTTLYARLCEYCFMFAFFKKSTWPRCKPHSFVAGTRKMLTRTRKSFLFS